MKQILSIGLLMAMSFGANALPISMSTPGVYDNAGGDLLYGQTFVAESEYVSGVRWYIGDPTRPGNTSVDALDGSAELVLFDIASPAAPIELARKLVQDALGSTFGLTTFSFASSLSVNIGTSYFIGLDADDKFGLGLGAVRSSTYANGYEGRLRNGVLEFAGGGDGDVNARYRDTVFEILNAAPQPSTSTVPEPSSILLFTLGMSGLFFTRSRRKNLA